MNLGRAQQRLFIWMLIIRFDLRREAQDDGGYDSTNEEDDYSKAR